ncbi:MAG: helix-turn-helix domain-containing protein [Sulfitobacter sp.]
MPDTFTADPKQGFVAFPMSVFDLDLCPGAFRTLAELCRMANLDGQCWPSLAQLGTRLGRSRAAISGYIAELREAGVLETETQKMANGYNYRLRYTVVFWKAWRKELGKSNERSVKPIERPLRTKNHIHKNQQSPAIAGFENLVSAWKITVGKAPYPDFASWPEQALLDQTNTTVKSNPLGHETSISADIARCYDGFLSEKSIIATSSERSACIEVLNNQVKSKERLLSLSEHLNTIWQKHWIKPPTPAQLTKAIRQLPPSNDTDAQIKLLKSYLRRWEIHQQSLPSTLATAKVAA